MSDFFLLDLLVRVIHFIAHKRSLFSWLCNITAYEYTTIYSTVLLLVDIWVVSDWRILLGVVQL